MIEPSDNVIIAVTASSKTGGGDPHDIEGITFVTIPSGSFRMGDISGEGDRDELPVHTVTVTCFEMSTTNITQKQYESTMGENSSNFVGSGLPVEKVSWHDVVN